MFNLPPDKIMNVRTIRVVYILISRDAVSLVKL